MGDLQILADNAPKLTILNLAHNPVAVVDALAPLAALRLRHLMLDGCPVLQTENAREKIFAAIPSLITLDGRNRYFYSLTRQ